MAKKQKAKKRSKLLNSGGDMVINKIQQTKDETSELRRQISELNKQIRRFYLLMALLVLLIITLLHIICTGLQQQAKCYENVEGFINGGYLQSLLGKSQILFDISAKVLETYN